MALVDRVRIYKKVNGEEIEVSDACSPVNGRANPFGWSSAQLAHHSRVIGSVYCGEVSIDDPDYRFTVTREEE